MYEKTRPNSYVVHRKPILNIEVRVGEKQMEKDTCQKTGAQQLPASCFTHDSARKSMLVSQFVSSPSRTVSMSSFSKSLPVFLPCEWVHQCHFSRFRIHVLM